MNWYLQVLKKYTEFEGRARRKEFWIFSLLNSIFSILLLVTGTIIFILYPKFPYNSLYGIYGVVTLLPSIAVSVRRLHDVGKSGKYFFLIFIPIVGAIWLLILFCTEGMPGRNPYGPNPKESELSNSIQ